MEPDPEGELVLERFGVKTGRKSKVHFVARDSLFHTVCGKYVGQDPLEVKLVEDGKFIQKKKRLCGNCRQNLNRLTKNEVKVRLMRVSELTDGDEER